MSLSAVLCSAKLRDGSPCGSVATAGDLCAHHSQLADDLGRETVVNGEHAKQRNARGRAPVLAESEPVELTTRSTSSPSSVRPALALTAAEEVETIRRVLLEAATSTTRETWATCICPECQKTFRQEISVPDHGARIKAVETLLREGLGRVGEAEVVEPKMPTSIAEVKGLGWTDVCLIFATSFAPTIRAIVDDGDAALRSEPRELGTRDAKRRRACPRRTHLSSPAESDVCLTRCRSAGIHRELRTTSDSASRRRIRYIRLPSPSDIRSTRGLVAGAPVKAKWETPVLLLGDFNDEPFDIAVIDHLQASSEIDRVTGPTNEIKSFAKETADCRGDDTFLYNASWRFLEPETWAPSSSPPPPPERCSRTATKYSTNSSAHADS